MDILAVLDAHGPYLSDRDEDEVVTRAMLGEDVAELALRTCLCGVRLDGFDSYHGHLVQVFRETIAGTGY